MFSAFESGFLEVVLHCTMSSPYPRTADQSSRQVSAFLYALVRGSVEYVHNIYIYIYIYVFIIHYRSSQVMPKNRLKQDAVSTQNLPEHRS